MDKYDYWDYINKREQEEREEWVRKRRTGRRNLTLAVIWLLDHDWKLLLSKNLYLIFFRSPDSYTFKLDGHMHVSHCIRQKGLKPDLYQDCQDVTLWQFLLYLVNEGLCLENMNYLHFVKDDKLVVLNAGNSTAQFVNNAKSLIKLYEGWEVTLKEDRISVTGNPVGIKSKRLKVKDGVKYLTKEDMMNIPLKSVWIKESRKFGE